TRARLIVREVIPGSTMGTVVLAHGPPLALAQVRSPELPALLAACVFGESHPLGRSDLAPGSRLDRRAHDTVLILDHHASASPITGFAVLPPRALPLRRVGVNSPDPRTPPTGVLDQAARA